MTTINAVKLPEVATPASPPNSAEPPEFTGVSPNENTNASTRLTDSGNDSAVSTGEKSVNPETLNQAVNQLDHIAKLANRSVQFKISDTGDDIQVLVIDKDTEEVIREIPPDAAIELADRIQGTLGLLIDKVA